ncbi:MAG: hypothetical protein K2O67_04735, partial [Clostridia bacterium]|nr:hypothetical protein [Clostridia bacterium]
MHVKLNLKTVLMYAAYAFVLVALNFTLPAVPFSLGVCFSMLICGTNLITTPVLYVLASVVNLDWITCLISLFEGGFLTLITFLYRRTKRKIRIEAALYIAIALAPFIAFSRWQGIENLAIIQNPYILKAIAAVTVIIFTYFAFKSIYALLFRLYRCKLRPDELICLAVTFAAAGVGLRNLIDFYAYACVAAGITAFAVRLTKSPAAIIVALICAAPLAVVGLNPAHLTAFVVISVTALAFCTLGRFAPALACCAASAVYLYLFGLYSEGIAAAVLYSILLAVCCALSTLPTRRAIEKMNALLSVKKVLPRTDEERYKSYVSEKLFRMSEVFREIENAFTALDDKPDDGAMKRRMLAETKQSMCT